MAIMRNFRKFREFSLYILRIEYFCCVIKTMAQMKTTINNTLTFANRVLEQLGAEGRGAIARNNEIAERAVAVVNALPEVLTGLNLIPEEARLSLRPASLLVTASATEGFEVVEETKNADADYDRAVWKAEACDSTVLERLQAAFGRRVSGVSFNPMGFVQPFFDGKVAFEVTFNM